MINSTLCYIEKDGAYLMLHRNGKKKNDVNLGKWVGIGGKFERGESPEECLLREVYEETGLTLCEYTFRGIVTFDSDQCDTEYMYLYTASSFRGEVSDCNEGDLSFVPIADLDTLPMWEGDRIFFSLIADGEPFFSLKLSYRGDDLVRAVLNGKELSLPWKNC